MLMLYLHISLRNIWRTESTKGAEFDTIFFLFFNWFEDWQGNPCFCPYIRVWRGAAEPAGAPLVGPWMYGVTSPIVPNGCI